MPQIKLNSFFACNKMHAISRVYAHHQMKNLQNFSYIGRTKRLFFIQLFCYS